MPKHLELHGRDHLPTGCDPIPGATTGGAKFTVILFDRDEEVHSDATHLDGFGFRVPDDLLGMMLVDFEAFVITPPTGGDLRLDMYRVNPDPTGSGDDTSYFVDRPRIDTGEYSSRTGGPAMTITDVSSVGTIEIGDWFFIWVLDDVGGAGLGVNMEFG